MQQAEKPQDVQVLPYRPTNVVDTSNQIWKYLRPQMLETFTMFPLERARWGIASWLSFKVLFRFTWKQCNAYLDITKKLHLNLKSCMKKKWIIFMNQNVVSPVFLLLAPTGALYVMVCYYSLAPPKLFEIFSISANMCSFSIILW